ncbi:MAG TPA: hypothetical protein VFL57_11090 [Bryobacteraceae bacterium]|nr:hypothetical protein [Bryobacteraceae bacterium]
MDWLNQIGGMLQQYASVNRVQGAESAERDFERFARSAPREEVAHGISETFRSPDTPPFPQMLGQLFRNSPTEQRATILNSLLGTLGPAVLAQVLSRHGGGAAGLGGLLTGSGQTHVRPEHTPQISPDAVTELAAQAEKKDPSIIDRMSDFYADQPQLVKTLGGAALAVALMQIGRKHKLL